VSTECATWIHYAPLGRGYFVPRVLKRLDATDVAIEIPEGTRFGSEAHEPTAPPAAVILEGDCQRLRTATDDELLGTYQREATPADAELTSAVTADLSRSPCARVTSRDVETLRRPTTSRQSAGRAQPRVSWLTSATALSATP
jgi:hypothetical protein